jgi:hypothetical protein
MTEIKPIRHALTVSRGMHRKVNIIVCNSHSSPNDIAVAELSLEEAKQAAYAILDVCSEILANDAVKVYKDRRDEAERAEQEKKR